MSARIAGHAAVEPLSRFTGDGPFYPGEAARILGCPHIEYRLLRRIYDLVRRQRGEDRLSGWARWTLTDLAAAGRVIALCGGPDRLHPDHRLTLGNLEHACVALREQGFANPLLEVTLVRQGKQFLAAVDGVVMDPATGQGVINWAYSEAAAWLEGRGEAERGLRAALRAELQIYEDDSLGQRVARR